MFIIKERCQIGSQWKNANKFDIYETFSWRLYYRRLSQNDLNCFKNRLHWKKKFDDTDIIVVPWPILYWRFTENQGFFALVQPVCVFQTYELLLQQYFWWTVKYILLNYLKTFSYIHMADSHMNINLITKTYI